MNTLFALGLPEGAEWFWIFIVVVLFFGANKIPDLARGLGRSVGEFKKAREEFEKEANNTASSKPTDSTDSSKKS